MVADEHRKEQIMSRHYGIFWMAFVVSVIAEFIAVLTENMVLLDCSIVSLMTVCLMWSAVVVSDRRAAKMRKRAARRQGARQ